MLSVSSELISKALTDMGVGGCDNASGDVSKHSNNNLPEDALAVRSSLNFGDGNCGETVSAQHLRLDFTPDDEEDTDSSQKKCCAFWDFIRNMKEMQTALVSPDLELTKLMEEPIDHEGTFTSTSSQDTVSKVKPRTAVSMLSFVQKKELIDRIFEVKTTQSKCSIGSREYPHDDGIKKKLRKPHGCKCRYCPHPPVLTPDVQALNSEMEKFDKEHPKCMPFCKNRRREWKGKILKTSAELLLDKKPPTDCQRIYPRKVQPNSPCPLFARKSHIKVQPIGFQPPQQVVRICQAPIDDYTDTTYTRYVELAKEIGAWKTTCSKQCTNCNCGKCCSCIKDPDYLMRDAERSTRRRSDMREFDRRVYRDREKNNMRNMYN